MPFTLRLRFNLRQIPVGKMFSTGEMFLASQYDSVGGNGWVLRVGSDLQPCFSFLADKVATHMSASAPLPPPAVSLFTAVVPIPLRTWIEIEVTHDGTTGSMYLNGHLCARTSGAMKLTDLPCKSGAANWSDAYPAFDGELGVLSLFDQAMSQDDVQRALWPRETVRFSSADAAEAVRQTLLRFIWDPGQPATEPDSMPIKALIEPIADDGRFNYLK